MRKCFRLLRFMHLSISPQHDYLVLIRKTIINRILIFLSLGSYYLQTLRNLWGNLTVRYPGKIIINKVIVLISMKAFKTYVIATFFLVVVVFKLMPLLVINYIPDSTFLYSYLLRTITLACLLYLSTS